MEVTRRHWALSLIQKQNGTNSKRTQPSLPQHCQWFGSSHPDVTGAAPGAFPLSRRHPYLHFSFGQAEDRLWRALTAFEQVFFVLAIASVGGRKHHVVCAVCAERVSMFSFLFRSNRTKWMAGGELKRMKQMFTPGQQENDILSPDHMRGSG